MRSFRGARSKLGECRGDCSNSSGQRFFCFSSWVAAFRAVCAAFSCLQAGGVSAFDESIRARTSSDQ
eukprot:119026-Alexandrium_andersonii.AAC.1